MPLVFTRLLWFCRVKWYISEGLLLDKLGFATVLLNNSCKLFTPEDVFFA